MTNEELYCDVSQALIRTTNRALYFDTEIVWSERQNRAPHCDVSRKGSDLIKRPHTVLCCDVLIQRSDQYQKTLCYDISRERITIKVLYNDQTKKWGTVSWCIMGLMRTTNALLYLLSTYLKCMGKFHFWGNPIGKICFPDSAFFNTSWYCSHNDAKISVHIQSFVQVNASAIVKNNHMDAVPSWRLCRWYRGWYRRIRQILPSLSAESWSTGVRLGVKGVRVKDWDYKSKRLKGKRVN